MKVKLTSRRSADARCAYCHDSLDGVVSSCSRCLTTFHKDCRAHLAQCPTLGCGTVFTHAPEIVADIEVEADAPSGLVEQMIREHRLEISVGIFCFFLLVIAFSNAALAWDRDGVVMGGFLVLGALAPVIALIRDASFLRAARALLRGTALRMMAEVRSEMRQPDPGEGEPERVFIVNLLGPAGEHLSFADATVPAWLLAPGVELDVFFAREGGPIVLRSARGDIHAVREHRVARHL